jgi:hypothetical protein
MTKWHDDWEFWLGYTVGGAVGRYGYGPVWDWIIGTAVFLTLLFALRWVPSRWKIVRR